MEPLIKNSKDLIAHNKFRAGTATDIDDALHTEKGISSNIQYCFAFGQPKTRIERKDRKEVKVVSQCFPACSLGCRIVCSS